MMNPIKVLVLSPFQEEHRRSLQADTRFEVAYQDRKQCPDVYFQEAEVIIGNPLPQKLRQASHVKLLQLGSAGSDGYTKEGVLPKDCVLCNASGSYGLAIAEHLVGVTLMLMKQFPRYLRSQQQHRWEKGSPIRSLYGSTVLIVGYGDIGSAFAKRAKAMGAYTIGIRRHVDGELPEALDELHPMSELMALLARADVVTLCLPSTPQTRHLFTWECFQAMKQDAYLLNVGRGDVLKNADLLKALTQGEIAGAAIDVFEQEPLPSDDPLWDQENLILTPHIAGGYWLGETFERFVKIALDNLQRFADHKPLRNVVDVQSGTRTRADV